MNPTHKYVMDNICEVDLSLDQAGLYIYRITVSVFDAAPTLLPYQDTDAAATALKELKGGTSYYRRQSVHNNVSHKEIRNVLFDITGVSQQANLNTLYILYNNGIANPYVSFTY